ncbi:MAG: hypothetical protein ONB48_17275 [candidate division KSB1 bacterium]|nr:hypothetical protein [candidate division KSB1 bacterium]MDZ7275231.1 hypothetical protein [candidate division KSB1 bacterium]MDZ7287399.1 hypothetical protein [candidate division KSB1 bacterium]MDZ7299513.1 hypothetical protein [candidate division KSB1 bacterium]MDZ7305442.1 hypothetical protein [candidate division KSB1 bacterium]
MMLWKEILALVLSIMKSKPAKRLFKKLTSRRARKQYIAIILLLLIVLLSMKVINAGIRVFRNLLSETGKRQVQIQQQIENLNEETAQLDRQLQHLSEAVDRLQVQREIFLGRLDILRDEHTQEPRSLDSSAVELVPAKQNRAPEVTIESFAPEPLAAHSGFDRPLQQRHTDLVDLIMANSDFAGDEQHVELIRQELVKHNAALADLFARHLKMTSGLKGHVKIRFAIDARGCLRMPQVVENGLRPEVAAARLLEEIQQKMALWRDFPATAEHAKTSYLVTYVFGSER